MKDLLPWRDRYVEASVSIEQTGRGAVFFLVLPGADRHRYLGAVLAFIEDLLDAVEGWVESLNFGLQEQLLKGSRGIF